MLLLIAMLYLSRAISLPLLARLASVAGVSSDTTALLDGLFSVYTLPPSLIASTVLCALIRRVPSASRAVRWIWTHGRLILVVAAVLDFALTLFNSRLWRGDPAELSGFALLAPAFDLYFFVYLVAARRVRDVFADFPAAAEPATGSDSAERSAPRNDP
jgi:hypothetical protein